MATLVNADPHGHRYWVRYPDGTIQEILSKAIKELAGGSYEITSVEPVVKPVPHIPPPTNVTVINVGQETIHFQSVFPEITLKESQSSVLKNATYYLSSVHIPPPK